MVTRALVAQDDVVGVLLGFRPLLWLRRTPEPLKRALRPVVVVAVDTSRAVPGGRTVAALLRRIAPRLHRWLRRRYIYYRDAGVGRPAPMVEPVESDRLAPEARRVAGWLSQAPANPHG